MATTQQPPAPEASPPPPGAPADEGMTAGQWARLGILAVLLVWLTRATGPYGLAMVLGIVAMITLHELGHFVMARRAGMKCTEFFLGFGPRIWSVQRGETEYGIKLIPAGAYVKVVGMHDIEEVDPADEPRTYRQQPFWQRFGVAVAGSTMHFLIALVLTFVVLVGFGMPGGSIASQDSTKWRVGSISEDSAASRAGLQEGDDIVAIDGRPVASFDDLRDQVVDRPDEEVTITVARDGTEVDLTTTLGRNPTNRRVGFLGIGPMTPKERLGPVEGAVASVREVGEIGWLSVKGLGSFFTPDGITSYSRQVRDARDEPTASAEEVSDPRASSGSASASSEGPEENRLLSLLGVFRIGVDAGEAGGAVSLLVLFIFINVFIGIFNLVPLLPFDGGHVAIAIYEKVKEWRRGDGRRYLADVGKLVPMTYAVVVVLGLIFVSSLYLDIVNPAQVN